MTPESQPPLPRRPDDPEKLARLREEARRRMDQEERPPAPVYGAPAFGGPAPVYGGPPIARRWTLRGIALLVLGALAALAAIFWAWGPRPFAPVYGGPPIAVPPEPQVQAPPNPPQPVPERPAAPVYGGPVRTGGKQ